MKSMQWDDVRYFLALARQGSLSATARHLGIEHTTVARRVSNLEEALSLRLFDRLPRGWTLTPEGQVLFERACSLEIDMQSLQRMALGQSALEGHVRITAPPLLLNHFVLPHLDEFHAQYPQIELELIGERRGAHLGRGEADIALRLSDAREPDLVTRNLGQIRYGLYGTPAWCSSPDAEQKFIGFDESLSEFPQTQWLDSHVGSRQYTFRSNDMQAMHQAAAQGWGIALLPRFLAAKEQRLQLLQEPSPPPLALYLLMHADVRRAPRIRCTADYLIQMFASHASEL